MLQVSYQFTVPVLSVMSFSNQMQKYTMQLHKHSITDSYSRPMDIAYLGIAY
jgi:hypothetical protein